MADPSFFAIVEVARSQFSTFVSDTDTVGINVSRCRFESNLDSYNSSNGLVWCNAGKGSNSSISLYVRFDGDEVIAVIIVRNLGRKVVAKCCRKNRNDDADTTGRIAAVAR